MSSASIQNMISALFKRDMAKAQGHFESAMAEKVNSALDQQKIAVAAKLYNEEKAVAQPESSEQVDEAATVDAKGHKSATGGLTQKGRDHYNRKTGSNLKAPVTTPPSELKKGSKAYNRRKSFCARMKGVEGPMKKPNGEPTRKALALRKWNC
jgi:hypothetical protein